MPPPDIPPSIQKPQKSFQASFARNRHFCVMSARPRNDLDTDQRKKVREVTAPIFSSPSPAPHAISSRNPCACNRYSTPPRRAAAPIFFRSPSSNRADVLRHAAMRSTPEAVLKLLPGRRRGVVYVQHPMCRHQSALLARSCSRSSACAIAPGSIHPGPHAAGILPSAARPADPLAQNRPRQHQPARSPATALRAISSGSCRHAEAVNDASRFVDTASPRAPLGDRVHVADDFQPAPRPRDSFASKSIRFCPRTFNARTTERCPMPPPPPPSNPQIIFREIKNVAQARYVRRGVGSTLVKRSTGSSITRRKTSIGGCGDASRRLLPVNHANAISTLTRLPVNHMPRKKAVAQAYWSGPSAPACSRKIG